MLRPYQQDALDQIRDHFLNGHKKVLLHLATGGGKTLIFCNILKAAKEKGTKAMMVVRGRKLIQQASMRLDREGVDHGVIMAGHWRNRPNQLVQLASIDTLYARRDKIQIPDCSLLVLDEAHFAIGDSFLWLINRLPNAYFLPVTATPHVKEGLRHIADTVVYPISIRELIAQKFLVAPKYFIPTKVNLADVKVDNRTGDYIVSQLSTAMENPTLYGDMVDSYTKHALNQPALIFCVSVAHSKAVAELFNQRGITAEHVDANCTDKERNDAIGRLESGATRIITNVGILTTGVDIPCVRCIILARPTKSYNLYIQILGRGTRPYPGKNEFVVLDHANAVEEHGFIENERECDLDGKITINRNLGIAVCVCKQCFFAFDPTGSTPFEPRNYICPECSHDNTPPRREISERVVDTSYVMKAVEVARIEETPIQFEIRKLTRQSFDKGYKPGWVYHKIREKHGEHEAKRYFQFVKKIYEEMKR